MNPQKQYINHLRLQTTNHFVLPTYEPLDLDTTFRPSSLSSQYEEPLATTFRPSPYEEYILAAPNYENIGRRLSLSCAYEANIPVGRRSSLPCPPTIPLYTILITDEKDLSMSQNLASRPFRNTIVSA